MDWSTHEVSNQVDELEDYNLYAGDAALRGAVARVAPWAATRLDDYGRDIGRAERFRQAEQANRHTPELQTFDRRGRRIDAVEFHPSWHALLGAYREAGWVSVPFDNAEPGRWLAGMAGLYLHNQVESGTMCPSTMTSGAIPLLREEPALWAAVGDKLLSRRYDPRDLPITDKHGIYVGMGMTEKQGGSDVRSNTTTATPVGPGGRGGEYRIRGHKWFFSAPMCDAHLVVARTADGGPSCFYVPRWRPDGTRNAVRIQRLKEKVGNRSNSSSEVEFQDAYAIQMGEEGRGIPLIIRMAAFTRLCCVASGAALMRQALVQAIAYTRRRQAFGRALAQQPLMRAVLIDLALESEAATLLMTRLAQSFEDQDPLSLAWRRLMTPAAKFWVCKRSVEFTGETMEVFGGNGYVDDGPLARLFREAPVNSIWEGSGNVMCLDLLRGIGREPQAAFALLDAWAADCHGDAPVLQAIDGLRRMLAEPPEVLEARGRLIAQHWVLVAQSALLRSQAPACLADAFIATRFGQSGWGRVAGAIDPAALDGAAILERALA